MAKGFICRYCNNISHVDVAYINMPIGPRCPYCYNYLWYYGWIPPQVVPLYSWDIRPQPFAMPNVKYIEKKNVLLSSMIATIIIAILLISAGGILMATSVLMHKGEMVTLTGQIYISTNNSNQNYASYAEISFYKSSIAPITTNNKGFFSVEIPSGVYTINISESGFVPVHAVIIASRFYTTNVGIVLNQTMNKTNENNIYTYDLTAFGSWSEYISSIDSTSLFFIIWGVLISLSSYYIFKKNRFGLVSGLIFGTFIVVLFPSIVSIPYSSLFTVVYLLSFAIFLVTIFSVYSIIHNRDYFAEELKGLL